MADRLEKEMRELIAPLRVEPGRDVHLTDDFDPGYTAGFLRKNDSKRVLRRGVTLLTEYQARLAAQDTYGLLVVLQGLDASGKDSTIKHVMSGVNPQGVTVHSFKVPSATELSHDYLWRYTQRAPARGEIGIFNRSHYEEVLVVRVHPENLDRQRLPSTARTSEIWDRRYREINDWERYLVGNGFRIVKLLLHISKEEQRLRFLARLDRPDKNWKFSPADIAERGYWDDYQRVLSEMLSHTSTSWAPWYVIPADHKWFARICVATVIIDALIEIDPHYPEVSEDSRRALAQARKVLRAEAP